MRQIIIILCIITTTTTTLTNGRQITREEYTDSTEDVTSSEQQYMVDHFESTRLVRNRT